MMGKNSIAWHKECAKSSSEHYARLKQHIDMELDEYNRGIAELNFYMEQIEQSEIKGKTHFDRDRFMKVRGKR